MAHLQEQLDELEVLESMFSSPGEFEIEDRDSHERAIAYLKSLAPDPPKYLSCRLCIPVNAQHDSDDEEESSRAEGFPPHAVNISIRLPTRSAQSYV